MTNTLSDLLTFLAGIYIVGMILGWLVAIGWIIFAIVVLKPFKRHRKGARA